MTSRSQAEAAVVFLPDDLTRDKFLDGKLHIWQPKGGYRAATDPVLLAAACPADPGESVLDIGCGVGTAALCLSTRIAGLHLYGLELQPDYADLARQNAAANGITMEVEQGDLTNMPAQFKDRMFDHVIMNPPFFGPGTKASDTGRALARQQATNLATWLDAGLRRIRPKGWLTVIQTIDRLPEIIVALNQRAGGCQIKPLSPRKNKPATRFVLRARKGSKSNTMLANPLILHKGDTHTADEDSYTTQARAILRCGHMLQF
ncbi:methyltransferase [Litoreibacter sp.]|nr:methyltransferase [Litoreibacter sp.]